MYFIAFVVYFLCRRRRHRRLKIGMLKRIDIIFRSLNLYVFMQLLIVSAINVLMFIRQNEREKQYIDTRWWTLSEEAGFFYKKIKRNKPKKYQINDR